MFHYLFSILLWKGSINTRFSLIKVFAYNKSGLNVL